MRDVYAEASNCSIRETPLFPSRMDRHVSSVPTPTEVSSPTPVTTTLRCIWLEGNGLLLLGLDVIHRVFNRRDLLGILIGNVDVEGFLERHHEFDDVQRIRAEIAHEGGGVVDLVLVHSKLFHNNLLYFLLNGHASSRMSANSLILATMTTS